VQAVGSCRGACRVGGGREPDQFHRGQLAAGVTDEQVQVPQAQAVRHPDAGVRVTDEPEIVLPVQGEGARTGLARLLRSIRDALRPGGSYLCLEINCSDRAAANVGPIATLLYGFSVLYCMTTSLTEGGEGLGTLGLPEPVLHELAGKAGFARVRQVEMDNPFNSLYELAR
jgi:hypothetical protein